MLVTLNRTKATLQQTLGDGVAGQLREEIISGSLRPGAMLAEIPTAERLGVSRVPVREALLVLERDGLLVFDERGRCRVRTLSARDLEEIYDTRLLLECESFRLAAMRHTAEQLSAMRRNIVRMEKARSIVRVTLLDIEFHELIIEAADHSRIAHLWAIMRGQIQIFTASLQRQLDEVADNVRETSVATHRECLEIIASRDAAAAAEAARKHLQTWREWLLANRAKGIR
jgi:DNA-binding GntR family transcriptional regulator